MILIKKVFLLLAMTFLFEKSYAQVDTLNSIHPKALVLSNTELFNVLKNYLIEHPTLFTLDSNRKRLPLSKFKLLEHYEGVGITSINLRFDSVYFDKSDVGIYKFRFMSFGEPSWLYIKYKDSVEFINLDRTTFVLNKELEKIRRFFRRIRSFSEQEKVKMLKGAMEVIYSNLYMGYSF